jgi:hypothetical protein
VQTGAKKPILGQIRPDSKPILGRFKAKQSQFFRGGVDCFQLVRVWEIGFVFEFRGKGRLGGGGADGGRGGGVAVLDAGGQG